MASSEEPAKQAAATEVTEVSSSAGGNGRAPKKTDWERDMVYLFIFPRAACIPNISPYCLKLETWLRMADIPYQNVNAGMNLRSSRGQLPFVELNGREICDSQFIIDALMGIFHKESLEANADATAYAFERLIEGSLTWVYHRLIEGTMAEMMSDKVMGKSLPSAVKLFSPILGWHFGNKLKSQNVAQGIGRYTLDEAVTIGKKDLKALSDYLGKKKYLTGDTPSRLDATAFGHLGIIWYDIRENQLKVYMASDCANLVEYLERVKTNYWPDWQRAIETLSLDSNWKMETKGEEASAPKIADAATAE